MNPSQSSPLDITDSYHVNSNHESSELCVRHCCVFHVSYTDGIEEVGTAKRKDVAAWNCKHVDMKSKWRYKMSQKLIKEYLKEKRCQGYDADQTPGTLKTEMLCICTVEIRSTWSRGLLLARYRRKITCHRDEESGEWRPQASKCLQKLCLDNRKQLKDGKRGGNNEKLLFKFL